MKLSIYEVYVSIEDQPQADRMKQICIDYGLPYWDDEIAFEMTCSKQEKSFFIYDENDKEFFIIDLPIDEIPVNTQVTESEFLGLVKIKFCQFKIND